MFRLCFLILLLPIPAMAQQIPTGSAERSVCGFVKEPFTFWMWSRAAGKTDPDAAKHLPHAEAIAHRTRDGRELRGYRLKSTAAGGAVRGSMLVAQGNAMLADQLLSSLDRFSKVGIESHIFDYRGYGNSEGRPRLQAIVGDYVELHGKFIAPAGGKRLLYGISFGGIVLLNAIGEGAAFDRAVIDGTPSRVSPHGCPERFDPVAHLPRDASSMLFVGGLRDRVVPTEDSRALFDAARERGARVELNPDFSHPFMDAGNEVHLRRMDLNGKFLAGERR